MPKPPRLSFMPGMPNCACAGCGVVKLVSTNMATPQDVKVQ